MSGPVGNAAAQQTTSKFQAFLNHPAGPKYVYLETTFLWGVMAHQGRLLTRVFPLQDDLLLGPYRQMGSRACWCQGPFSSG